MLSKDKTGADIDSKKGSNTDRNKKSRIAIVLTVIGVLVLIALVVLIIIIAKQGKDQGESGRNVGTALSRNIVITPDNADEMIAQLKSEDFVQPGYYCVEMNTTWHFAKWDAVSEDAFVKNDIENTNDVYFDVFLASDESVPILQSPIIPRGSELSQIALDVPLDEGSNDCVMVYHLVDEEGNSISTLRVSFTIVIGE